MSEKKMMNDNGSKKEVKDIAKKPYEAPALTMLSALNTEGGPGDIAESHGGGGPGVLYS